MCVSVDHDQLENSKTSAVLRDFDNISTLRHCGNSTTQPNCLAKIGFSMEKVGPVLKNSTNTVLNISSSTREDFLNSHDDQTNKLRRKRNLNNYTLNSTNLNQTDKLENETEVLADNSYVNPVLERAPLPYTNLKNDYTKHGNTKPKLVATVYNHELETQENIQERKNSKENSSDNIHPQPSKPKYVFAPVAPTLKKYKVIQRKPDSKFQESSPPHVIYSDESDDSLFDYIEDMRTKHSNLYPYKFPDFNFPNLNHASFNFDDSDEDSEGLRDGEQEKKEDKRRKQPPPIIDAHDSHDMEHEYVASEEGVESEKREKTQQPENDTDDEDSEEEDEEDNDDHNDENKQEVEEDEEYVDEGDGEQKSQEENGSEEEEENKEDGENQDQERAKNYHLSNHQHKHAQGPDSAWRPNGFPINYVSGHNSHLQNNMKGEYDIPVIRYPYSSTDDIKQDFISHPLAGPTASKGFNHDFTPLRGGRPLKGPFGIEPPHKYPIVPLFNKNTLHQPLSTSVPAGPVSPINLSGFNGYKHFVAPLVSAEDQTPFNKYNNPRQSGSRYRATYRGGSPHGLKAHKGGTQVEEDREENEGEKEDELPPETITEDGGNLNYPDFDDFDLPSNPYIHDNSSNTQITSNHRMKHPLSTNDSPNNFNFHDFEGKNQHISNYYKTQPDMNQDDPNYNQPTPNNHNHRYRKPKTIFNPHPKHTSTSSKNKFSVHGGNGQPSKPFLDKLQGGYRYIENPEIQESEKYDYTYGSNENEQETDKSSYPSVNGAIDTSNYPTKTYEKYSFPKNMDYNHLHYPTIKSNHKNYDGLKEITKYDKFKNYPVVNDSSFEFNPHDNVRSYVDFKSVPYNFTSGVFGDLTEKNKYFNSMKNTNPFAKLQIPSSDIHSGKDYFPTGYNNNPFSTNQHYHNPHDSTKRPSETHYGLYNVPPYESINNYRTKNLGNLSPTPSSKEFDIFGNLNEKLKNHKSNKSINKNRNKSKQKKKSQDKKKKNSNSKSKSHRNRPKTNSKELKTQENSVKSFDTIPNPSNPLETFGDNRLKLDFTGRPRPTDRIDFEKSNIQPLSENLNADHTRSRSPKKSIYDLHGFYHSKNVKGDGNKNMNDDDNDMRVKLMEDQAERNILGTRRAASRTNSAGFHSDFPNNEQGDQRVPLSYSYDELDEPRMPTEEAPKMMSPLLRKLSENHHNRPNDMILEKGKSKSLSKKELVETLNKILDEKDAISREKNIDENGENPGKYSNYWVLEYSMPTE